MTGQQLPKTTTNLARGLWLRAYREGRVDVTLGIKADVSRMRFALYNAVKSFRGVDQTGLRGEQLELAQAVADCRLQIDGLTLSIVRSDSGSLEQAMLNALGGLPPAVDAPELTEAGESLSASLSRVIDALDGQPDAGEVRRTPYYTRGD